jgi:hypothetical protein
MDSARTPRPPSRLIHIGPHKTGTTTVQSAFHHNRDALRAHGVHYVGPYLQPTEAAKAAAGSTPEGPRRDRGRREWETFLTEAWAADSRAVVLSSEFLCEADDEAASRILGDFANDDTRVVVTLRPLAKIIPSQWQQFVQSGSPNRFEDWVTTVLETADDPVPKSAFWKRHRDDRVIARWAAEIGAENVTVIISDDRDPGRLIGEFARLLELPGDVLVPRSSTANRSLSWEEAEVIRHFNIAFKEMNNTRLERGKRELDLPVERRLAAWQRIKSRPPHEGDHRIELPAFAVDRIVELSEEMLKSIQALGVEVIGPTDQLVARPKPGSSSTPVTVHPRLVAEMATGLVVETIQRPRQPRRQAPEAVATAPWQRVQRKLRYARKRLRAR